MLHQEFLKSKVIKFWRPSIQNGPYTYSEEQRLKMAKGKSWNAEEDVSLAKAWVSVSENAVTGSEQKLDTFWTAVHSVPKLASRTLASIRQRWSIISHNVSKFLSAFEQVKILNPSGKKLEEMMNDAWDICAAVCKLEEAL